MKMTKKKLSKKLQVVKRRKKILMMMKMINSLTKRWRFKTPKVLMETP